MTRKWKISDEDRKKLEQALDIINKDYCDYVSGKKDKRDFPMVGSYSIKDTNNV